MITLLKYFNINLFLNWIQCHSTICCSAGIDGSRTTRRRHEAILNFDSRWDLMIRGIEFLTWRRHVVSPKNISTADVGKGRGVLEPSPDGRSAVELPPVLWYWHCMKWRIAFKMRWPNHVYQNAFRPNAFWPNAFRPNAFRPNAFRPNVFRPNAFWPNVFRPNVLWAKDKEPSWQTPEIKSDTWLQSREGP